ncbi:hypothetical protein H6G90_34395 [Nostoc sp. FACHB-145]|nr:hypothetical protein [Nostoc sp. FACHB-145]
MALLIEFVFYTFGVYITAYVFDKLIKKAFKFNSSNYFTKSDKFKIILIISLIITSMKLFYFYNIHKNSINNVNTFNALASTTNPKELMVGSQNFRAYSVMYRVWDEKTCINKLNGNIVDSLVKNQKNNGFVCISLNFDYIGKEDTIGINFQANDLAKCQNIVAMYWSNSPRNRYSWYPNPAVRERKQFKIEDNTCSVEYPN